MGRGRDDRGSPYPPHSSPRALKRLPSVVGTSPSPGAGRLPYGADHGLSGARGVSLSHTGQALQPTIGGGADAALSRASTPQPTTPPAEETRVVVVGLGACGGGLALDAAALASVRLAASPLACPQQPVGGRGGSDRAAAPQTAQRPAHWREEPQHVARRSTLSTDGFIPLRHRLIA